MKWLLATLAVVSTASPVRAQEPPRIPKDSVQVVVIGCLTGRALRTLMWAPVPSESPPSAR
jgi:hypothetical protein